MVHMKNRSVRLTNEIENLMAKVTSAWVTVSPFMVDEYACLICNAYFRKQIYQSDLKVIEDLIVYFSNVASLKNAAILREILETTKNLTKNIDNLRLDIKFSQVLSDDLKNKLRNTYETKPNKDSRVHSIEDLPGEEYDDFYGKYARDLDANWLRNVERFTSLRIKKPSRILDIGCGFGLFSHIAKFNGHIVDSLDMPNASPILKVASKILEVDKYEFLIKPNTPLLKFKNKFDHVTAFQIVFNGHASKDLWDVDEWKFFLSDLHDNVLKDDGQVSLFFNGEHRGSDDGVMVDGEQVYLGKKSVQEFFQPFFANATRMARADNKMLAILTKKNIKEGCQTNAFKKQSYSLNLETGKYG